MTGADLPIIQAPMAGVQDHRLAVAVCNAGGLGSLPAAQFSADDLGRELKALASQTDKPYVANFFSHTNPLPDPNVEQRWRERLTPFYREFGIDPESIEPAAGRMPFGHDVADVVEEFRPPIVSFHFGLPAKDLVDRVRSWGSRIWSTATTLDEARWLEARGVDAIIVQGREAGGHRGMFLTDDVAAQPMLFDLLAAVIAATKLPVIAAGGIAKAAEVRQVLATGAIAAQVGTSYLLCDEATTPALHRAALANGDAERTAITNVFTGRAARGIVNRMIKELGPMSSEVPGFPRAASFASPLRAAAERAGRNDFSSMWAGENIAGVQAVSARAITESLVP